MNSFFDKAEQYYDACLKAINSDNLTLAYLPIMHLSAECYLCHILTTVSGKSLEELYPDRNGQPCKYNIPHDLNLLYGKIFDMDNAKDYAYFKRSFKDELKGFTRDFKDNRFLTPDYKSDLNAESLYCDFDLLSDCRDFCEKFMDKYISKQKSNDDIELDR